MTQELLGKVAVVTGGASGIGKATVELFAAEGAKVVIADLAEEKGQALSDALGEGVAFCKTNVADAQSVEQVVAFAVEKFGGLDVMFNNAGVSGAEGSSSFLNNDFSNFEKVMAVDLMGPMLGTKYAASYMIENGGGSIINTASIAASYSGYGVPEYRAAKAGVVALTKSLATEFGEHGIRVNSISPGPIQTEMVGMDNAMPAESASEIVAASMEVMMDMQVLKRLGQPVDIAQAALFLASEKSAQITGIDLVVDGGASLGDKVNRQARMEQAIAAIVAGS